MNTGRTWFDVREHFLRLVSQVGKSERRLALELGVSNVTLGRWTRGEAAPNSRTMPKILDWIDVQEGGGHPSRPRTVASSDAEDEVVRFFLRNNTAVAELLQGVLAAVSDPRERRLVALAVLTSVKRSAIQMGRPIPRELWDLEEKLLNP